MTFLKLFDSDVNYLSKIPKPFIHYEYGTDMYNLTLMLPNLSLFALAHALIPSSSS